MEKLLQEDDCAPDAREYFIKEMKEKYNLDYADFFTKGKYVEIDDLCMQRHHDGFVLEYNGDDPYYILYKKDSDNATTN